MDEKQAVIKSQAGMRFIAQMKIYNDANWDRLRTFIEDSYSEQQLITSPAKRRLLAFKAMYKINGKLKVKKVLATRDHHVIIVLEAEKNDLFYYTEMQVGEEYPHKITAYEFVKLEEVIQDSKD